METFNELSAAIASAFSHIAQAIKQYLPSVLGAVALLFAGWLVARVLRALTMRLARLLDEAINRVLARRHGTKPKIAPVSGELLGNIVFWLVILFFVTAATQVLGLTVFLGWLDRLVNYLPSLFAGALIVIAGFLLARLSRDLVVAAAPSSPQRILLARMAQLAILATSIVIGADQVGIKINFLVIMATVVMSTVLGGGALALSLGARDYVANLIGAHYLRQAYRVGQRIRLAGYEGLILEITPTTVILETPQGRTTLPARLFQEQPSVALMGSDDGTDKNET